MSLNGGKQALKGRLFFSSIGIQCLKEVNMQTHDL